MARSKAARRSAARAACDRKKPMTRRDAEAAADRLRRDRFARVQAYRCPVCGRWHVGHPPYWVRQSIRDRRAS